MYLYCSRCFVEKRLDLPEDNIIEWLEDEFRLDKGAARTIVSHLDEQNKIAAIYGIADVVARVNAISWPYDIDKHMHFQYYSGPPVIPWEDIQ